MTRPEGPALTVQHGWVDSVDAITDEAVTVLLDAEGDHLDEIEHYIDAEGWQSYVDVIGEVRRIVRGHTHASRSYTPMKRSAIAAVSWYVDVPSTGMD